MFAYCENNPVMFTDPEGTCRHAWYLLWLGDCKECKAKYEVKYDVPLYKQGDLKLCWAFCETMIESFRNDEKLSQKKATARAKDIAVSVNGKAEWNRGNWPTNLGEKIKVSDINDLFDIVSNNGPVYAYYANNSGNAHLVVVTGVNLKKGIVYTNNPWGVRGKQTFSEFSSGVACRRNQTDMDMEFIHIYLAE